MHAAGLRARNDFIDREVVQRILKATDFAVLLGAAVIVSILNAAPPLPAQAATTIGFFSAGLALLCILAARSMRLYDVQSITGGWTAAAWAILACAASGGVLFEALHLLLPPISQIWLAWWFLTVALYFPLSRIPVSLWARPVAAAGGFRKRVAIVGGGKTAAQALELLQTSAGLDIDIVGLFDDRDDARSPGSLDAHRKLGRIADLAVYARQSRVDLIIVAIPLSAEARLLHILKRLWELPADIRISGQASSLRFGRHAYTYLGKLPLLTAFDRPLNGWSLFLKSAMDRSIAGLAIVLLSPVILATALAVKLDSKGPVVFRQKRYGFNNELIEVFKFRSMYADRSDANAARLVTKGDPRVTRVGRIIRKASLDELPQLFNVLTGQLSLVGPRPHATQAKAADALYEQVVDGYFARHKVKPGITGWAQVNGWRGETDTREKIEQRVKHDLEYIDRWSLGLDLAILVRTPFALLKSENAY